jgi:serine/threonine protein kinase
VLTQAQIAHYLVADGLASAESITDGDFEVVEASRRNSNFKVVSDRGPSYLLKQLKEASAGDSVSNEARVYRLLQEISAGDTLLRYIPRVVNYDSNQGMLVVELLRNSRDLYEHCQRCDRIPVRDAAALGRALSSVHRITGGALDTARRAGFMNHCPGVLYIHRPGISIFRDTSSANLQVIRIVQNTPGFAESLDRLRDSWRVDSIVHNDIKWDNCVVSTEGSARAGSSLKIVDWEFACLGDSRWDAGAVFGAFLGSWILSIPVSGDDPPDHFLELARYPLSRMHNAIRAFWNAYTQGRKFNHGESAQSLLRAVQYGAARLIQTAFEQMQHSATLTGNVVCLLQLSFNILQRPREAAVQLLGLPTGVQGGL